MLPPGRGRVVASFRRAAYVEVAGSVLAVTAADVPPGPLHLRLSALPRLQVGDPMVATAARLTIGAHTVAWAELVAWRPPVVPGPALTVRAGAGIDLLPEAGSSALADDPAAAAAAGRPAPRRPSRRGGACWPGGDRGSRRPATTCWPGSCSCWPSPATTGPSSSEPRPRRARTPSPERSCSGRREGRSVAPVHHLLAALAGGDGVAVERHRSAVAALGQTSGADVLLGLRLGLGALAGPVAAPA